MNPLPGRNWFFRVWRVLYPIGIHMGAGLLVGQALVVFLLLLGKGVSEVSRYSLAATGVTGLLTIPISGGLIWRDNRKRGFFKIGEAERILGCGEVVWMALLGISLCHLVNMLLAVLQLTRLFPGYEELSEQVFANQNPLWMILWAGIVAPIAEELIFRGLIFRRLRDYVHVGWAIGISAFLFGIYHGNVLQFIYAGILGACFAYCYFRLDSLWAPVVLHIGANCWSVILTQLASAGNPVQVGYMMLVAMGVEMVIVIFSIINFARRSR